MLLSLFPGTDIIKEEENQDVSERKGSQVLPLSNPSLGLKLQAAGARLRLRVGSSVVVVVGFPKRLYTGSCLTSAWQCLVPALRALESQGGLSHVPTEGGQLGLTNV